MRKFIGTLTLVFAVALAVGAATPKVEAALCTYRCICSVPHKCCVVNGQQVCKPVPNGPLQCPQDMPC